MRFSTFALATVVVFVSKNANALPTPEAEHVDHGTDHAIEHHQLEMARLTQEFEESITRRVEEMQQGLAERIETIQRKQNQEMADYMRHFRRKAMEVVESFPENPELNQKLEENFRRMEEFANELTGQA